MTYLSLTKEERELIIRELPSGSKKLDNLRRKVENSMKVIKPRSAKNKGLDFQKKVAKFISSLIGIEATQDDDSLIQSRLSGQNGTDIILRGEAKERFPFSVECKNCTSVSLPQWVEQARQNSSEESPWLLFIHSKSLGGDVVVMDEGTFEKIFKEEK